MRGPLPYAHLLEAHRPQGVTHQRFPIRDVSVHHERGSRGDPGCNRQASATGPDGLRSLLGRRGPDRSGRWMLAGAAWTSWGSRWWTRLHQLWMAVSQVSPPGNLPKQKSRNDTSSPGWEAGDGRPASECLPPEHARMPVWASSKNVYVVSVKISERRTPEKGIWSPTGCRPRRDIVCYHAAPPAGKARN